MYEFSSTAEVITFCLADFSIRSNAKSSILEELYGFKSDRLALLFGHLTNVFTTGSDTQKCSEFVRVKVINTRSLGHVTTYGGFPCMPISTLEECLCTVYFGTPEGDSRQATDSNIASISERTDKFGLRRCDHHSSQGKFYPRVRHSIFRCEIRSRCGRWACLPIGTKTRFVALMADIEL